MRLFVSSLVVAGGLLFAGCDSGQRDRFVVADAPSKVAGPSSGLPLPSTVDNAAFEKQLYSFIGSRAYVRKGWRRDKRIRDTGPYQNKVYYGTHPAVRIYYSPEMITWLKQGRVGEVPDGAMIIKEMFPPPAARYLNDEDRVPQEWTVMIRDKAGSVDGWYWSYYGTDAPEPVDSDQPPYNYPNSGFGLYCVRCHGSAESMLTFSSTANIEGFPGEPIVYAVDNSWMTNSDDGHDPHPNGETQLPPSELPDVLGQMMSQGVIDQQFLDYFDQFPADDAARIVAIPGVTSSHAVADGHRQFVTSDQCLSCHSGDNTNFGPNMLDPTKKVDISPWGEWSWSMMGLAGRDPIFFAQLETEIALHSQPGGDFNPETIANFCLRCHGVMGKRQFNLDKPGQPFSLEDAMASAPDDPNHEYGGLARDGISCTVCHQIQDQTGLPISEIDTGEFVVKPAIDGLLTIFGPFANPTVRPMQQALGMQATGSEHVKDSLLCASCHTVDLPVLDSGTGKTVATKYEQATYAEWLNSTTGLSGPGFKSCQDCHMPNTFHNGDPLEFKIANVQDQDFPETDNTAPVSEITVNPRPGFARHTLTGINVFGLELFRQFPVILGVNPTSFMTGFSNGIDNSIDNALQQAANSARLEVVSTSRSGSALEARVKVTNLAGHRFPSGVGFRRLIMQVLVRDAGGNVVWSSGRTNDLGIVIDEKGNALPGEGDDQSTQPHYQVVDSQSKAQIYEERTRNTDGELTTSFLGRFEEIKDNRLLPIGWTKNGPAGMDHRLLESTQPGPVAVDDPDFTDGTGSDTVTYKMALPSGASGPVSVEASLYYQAIPPYYLQQRFNQAKGPNTERLHFITSRLDVAKSPFPQWKLLIAKTATVTVP